MVAAHDTAPGPLVVAVYAGGGVGGAAQHLRTLLPALRREGLDVRLLSLPPHAVADDLVAAGVPVVRAETVGAALAEIERLRPALLHVHGTRPALVALRARVPFVRTVHSFIHQDYPSLLRRLPALWIDRRSLQRARRVIAVSEALRQHLLRRGVPAAKVVAIPNGVPEPPPAVPREAFLAELGWPGDTLLLVVVARLVPLKGVDRAIAALPLLPPTARLAVFGEGDERPALVALAERLGLGDRVRFLGYRRDVRRYLGVADAVLVPSRQEGLSLVAVEAMAAGVPVVASDLPALREVLGEAGTLVDGSPAAFAEGVRRAQRDRARLAELGVARFRERFAAAAFATATAAVLRGALAER